MWCITNAHKRLCLLVVERHTPGFERGRILEKVGLEAQDTAELFFTDARVPVANLLGSEGMGFLHLVENLPQERLSIAVGAVAAARQALRWTLAYTHDRTAFGQPIAAFQNSRFVLAECATEIEIAEIFLDRCIEALNAKELTVEEAAMAKLFASEMAEKVCSDAIQIHGGYGYVKDFPVERIYRDVRVCQIYEGTSDIQKILIVRALV